ncbi:TIGR01458 family HAD-type hydrolase [Poseidonocella sp. HB161398]|uniref:TIGR01458 family HAD-type hydrolase n=1 Tax=Poseidonocella sp. HB161398 TaxID=2320855 RepID=UPI0011081607|nr:TIGR01458 family HAD-type hydrolase [Poseidonocella sp. HB161398]
MSGDAIPARGVLLDIAGVLLSGRAALPGAAEAVARLREAGTALRFVTNTTSRPRRVLLAELQAAGIGAAPDELFTPAAAARAWLAREGCRPELLAVPELEEDFAGLDPAGPPALVVGDAGTDFTYDRLNAALRLLLEGAPFLALAMNRRFADAQGRAVLDAGAFVAALAHGSGREPRLFGKPAPEYFRAACRDMGVAPGEAAMIGDDAEADVAGARAAGIGRALLVETGKYRAGDAAAAGLPDDVLAADIGAAVARLLGPQ